MSCCNSNCNHDPCGSSFNQSLTRAAQYAQYAQTQANKAENLWEEFNALYLGAFAVAPTQDNQGNPLQVGALYWNTGANELYSWTGLAWVTATGFNELTPFLSTGSTTPRNLANRFADVVNVKDFGAVGDGVTDDTAAIQVALNYGKSSVFLPEGNYKITASITIPENVTLFGTLQPMQTGAMYDGAISNWRIPTNASIIQVAFGAGSTSQSNSPIRLQRNSCVKGISFYYPLQSFSSPTPYPPTVSLKPIPGTPVTEKVYGAVIESCHFCNPWIAIEFTEKNGRCMIRNICGYAFKNFLFIDNGDEVNRVENIQLNPINTFYGDWPANYILNWQFVDKSNSAIKIGSSDLLEIKDAFCFGFWNGINIKQFSTLIPNGIFITQGGFEGCARCVVIEGASHRRIVFSGVQFGTTAQTSDWNLNPLNWPLCIAITVYADSLSAFPNEIKFVNCQLFKSISVAYNIANINDISIINCGIYNSNILNQGFSTQVIQINNSKNVKINGNTIEQNFTNTLGNFLNIGSTNGFIVENNILRAQSNTGSNIFIANSTAGRLNNNIQEGTIGGGVGQLGSTNVVSTNYVQY